MTTAQMLAFGIISGFGGSILGTGWSLWKRDRYVPGAIAGIVGTALIALVTAAVFKH